jgi:RimJ/RimL family protein N-acetyltransferase
MPTVETARLCLRMFHPDDLDSLAALVRDPYVMKFVGNGLPATRAEAEHALHSIIRHWDNHGFGRWAVIDKTTQEFAGFGGLRLLQSTPEVVYHLGSAYWGRGLATELARASLRFGFEEHQFDRIVAIAKPENTASVHVMKKLGMHYDMHTTFYGMDVVQYCISRAEFKLDDSTYIVKRGNAG